MASELLAHAPGAQGGRDAKSAHAQGCRKTKNAPPIGCQRENPDGEALRVRGKSGKKYSALVRIFLVAWKMLQTRVTGARCSRVATCAA